MSITFRYAVIADLAFIVDVYNSYIPSKMVTADLTPLTVADRNTWFLNHNETQRPVWIIEYNQKDAGWLSFSSFYGRPAYAGTVELSVYIHESYQQLGIGKAALLFAQNEAVKRQIHTLLGFIFEHNTPSVNLFQRMGYSKWGHLPAVADMDGRFCDLLIFGLKTY